MADIKRDFLYQFNSGLFKCYSNEPSIVSVFENIDKGELSLCPSENEYSGFLERVNRCIFIIKKIVTNPYVVVKGKQEIVPAPKAQNVNHESIKLTTLDASLWAKKGGKDYPKSAYSLSSEDVFTNYENAFIYQLIILLITRLRSIRSKIARNLGIKVSGKLEDSAANNFNAEQVKEYNTICLYIDKLVRLSKEKVFADNRYREINLSNVYITDILASEKRYNFCYKFFCNELKNGMSQNINVNDYRVLYHNFALIQLMYHLYKIGYKFNNANYYIAQTGKIFVDAVEFVGSKKLLLTPSKNGVDISTEDKIVRVEFSKSSIRTDEEIKKDYNKQIQKLNQNNKYSKVYVAHMSSLEQPFDGILSIGYKNVEDTISKLIEAL
ncbi:MAG: hypothetical protein E7596_06615 [Ruminococcaceae bacterium]|nr:hypothetical protein [Oscillospiraceae bacterium]